MKTLLDKKRELMSKLKDIEDQLRFVYEDSGGAYKIEFINSGMVAIRIPGYEHIPIRISTFIFDKFVEFYQKQRDEEKTEIANAIKDVER